MSRLRSTPRLLGIACLALVVVGLSVAARPVTASPDEQLHEFMMGIKRQLKELGRAVQDPAENAKSLAALAEMQAIALAAKTLDPSNLDTIAKDERDAHKAAFRADMARMLKNLVEMEIDVLEGRNADAAAILQGPLFELRDASHAKYQEQDDHGGGGR